MSHRSGENDIVAARRLSAFKIAIAAIVIAAAAISIAAAPGVEGLIGAVLALIVAAIAIADARYFLIPNELTAAGLALGLVNAALQGTEGRLESVAFAMLRGGILALAFLGLRALYRRLRGRDGLGLGDVKLAGVAGVWLDWLMLPYAVEIAALAALAFYALRKFVGGRPVHATTRLPFGLFLAPAIWLCWLLQSISLPPF